MADDARAPALDPLVRKLLAQSPPGELPAVAQNLRTLLGDAAVDAVAAAAFRDHNTAHTLAVDLPDGGGKVLITADAELDAAAASFLEPRTAQVVTFDHVKQVCTAVRPAEAHELAPPQAEQYRAAVERALAGYLAEAYAPNGHSAVYARADGATGSVRLTVCVCSALLNAKNFWSGAVRSRWSCVLPPADVAAADVALEGRLEAEVHYFEDGNVQLATRHDATARAAAAPPAGGEAPTPDTLAAAIVAAIRAAEGDYYGGLEASFDALAGRTFKELRRALPVTRAKFPWEQAQHKLAIELAAKEKAAAAATAAAH